MKDRYGFTFDERCALQRAQLARWAKVLRPEIYESLVAVCSARNQPSDSSDRPHRVAVGDELAHLVLLHEQHDLLIEAALMSGPDLLPTPQLSP